MSWLHQCRYCQSGFRDAADLAGHKCEKRRLTPGPPERLAEDKKGDRPAVPAPRRRKWETR